MAFEVGAVKTPSASAQSVPWTRPIAATSIETWPEVLMLQLKRWEHVHNVIGHKVHCNETLTVAGHQYRLQSLRTLEDPPMPVITWPTLGMVPASSGRATAT